MVQVSKEDLEGALKSYQDILADIEKNQQHNSRLLREWDERTAHNLKAALYMDGLILQSDLASATIYIENYTWLAAPKVRLVIKVGGHEVNIEFSGDEITRFSASGLSTHGDNLRGSQDMIDFAAYYKMVGDLADRLNKPLPNYKTAIQNIGEAEFEEWGGMKRSDVLARIHGIEANIAKLDLHLFRGKEVRVRVKNVWLDGVVWSITEKNIKVRAECWNYLIPIIDVPCRIRAKE